jgi:hypothetical protein
MPIVKGEVPSSEISSRLRELPLGALREMLPDADVLEACRRFEHRFRRRRFDPVVTVLHYLAQAVQREESFAATWQELWGPVAADLPEAACAPPDYSGLTHARRRLPLAVLQWLAAKVLRETPDRAGRWRGLRLVALDGTTVSMPREAALFDHFGAHRARTTTVRYPLARLCSLLAVGTSTILDYRFGPFRTSEEALSRPLLAILGAEDLLLADRGFSGSPTLARLALAGRSFLMRKNARLIVDRLKVVQRLGRYDLLVELPVSKPARKADPTLPETVRVRVFRATWKAPSGERITNLGTQY